MQHIKEKDYKFKERELQFPTQIANGCRSQIAGKLGSPTRLLHAHTWLVLSMSFLLIINN